MTRSRSPWTGWSSASWGSTLYSQSTKACSASMNWPENKRASSSLCCLKKTDIPVSFHEHLLLSLPSELLHPLTTPQNHHVLSVQPPFCCSPFCQPLAKKHCWYDTGAGFTFPQICRTPCPIYPGLLPVNCPAFECHPEARLFL